MCRLLGGRSGNFRINIGLIIALILIMSMFLIVSPAWGKPKAAKPQWTFMVYLDADNNLDEYGYQNMDAMKTVGSTPAVNIIVLWDKYDDVANLYKVTTGEPELVTSPLNGQEANMGDPETLKTFVKYTMKKFSADHYVLVLWDHGDDFRGCCWDDHPEDHLTQQEITQALSEVKELDILAFDMCVEGMIEVVYEYVYEDLDIDYVVATEGYVPNWGFPYATILANLTARPDMNAFDLSKVIVDDYVDFYETMRPASRLVELAAIDMSLISNIVQQLADLTSYLRMNIKTYHGMIAEARGKGNLGWSEYGWEAYVDLPTFVKSIYQALELPEAKALYDTLTNAIYVQASRSMESAEGLGIFFPNSHASFQNNVFWHGDDYLAMQFPHEGWWDFLQVYWGN